MSYLRPEEGRPVSLDSRCVLIVDGLYFKWALYDYAIRSGATVVEVYPGCKNSSKEAHNECRELLWE